IDLEEAKIAFTKSGIYLLMFCLGLMSSSFATGTNILFLLDFFLFSVLLFNYLYLKLLAKSQLKLEIPSMIFEDEIINLKWNFSHYYPMKAKVYLSTNRFGHEKEYTSTFFFFNSDAFTESFIFPLRGLYKIQQLQLQIEFPFPLFVLEYEKKMHQEIYVLPKAHETMIPNNFLSESDDLNSDEFYQFREYVNGDSMKRIAWKQYAKTNKLMIVEQSSMKKSTEVFSLDYTKENEKEYFNGVSRFFLNLIHEHQDFSIIGEQSEFQTKRYGFRKEELLKFLASYNKMSPSNEDADFQILGSQKVL
ncbi:DUF58 domain-containing protein, partial [bacterium]|nr:DUF58 domain-containing protein [bacterium]